MPDVFDPSKYRVALFAGGKSGERSISLASGAGAQSALEEAGFDVTHIDPAKIADLKRVMDGEFDVAFLTLHGKYGEDGTVQGFLELIGLPYTGSNVWSSALAMDKAKAKVFYEQAGIATPPSVTLHRKDAYQVDEIIEHVGSHCVVKPGTEGSALGVFIVDGAEEVEDALAKCFEIDEEVLVERYIAGTELTAGVLGSDELIPLPIIEIVPKSEFYDFEAKYAPGGSDHICPARISDEVTAEIQEAAVKAHQALSCFGVSRSDFILEENGDFWILETNTLPGMTNTSLLPEAARISGISFSELCTMLVKSALERAEA